MNGKKKRWMRSLGINLGKPFIETVFRLNKKIFINESIIDKTAAKGKSIILCSWHGRLIFPIYYLKDKGIYILAGLHEDAEIISRIGEKMGNKVIRGSSTLGGTKAYRKIIDILKKPGSVIGITPDGPKGPGKKVKMGAVKAAIHTGAVIIPMSGQASRRWEIKNWETFIMPKPFGKISFVFGDPIEVNREKGLKEEVLEIENKLNRIQELADDAAA